MLSLTWRQVNCIWERYWERKMWELEVSILTNPLAGGESDSKEPGVGTIDATTDEGLTLLMSQGVPIKRM